MAQAVKCRNPTATQAPCQATPIISPHLPNTPQQVPRSLPRDDIHIEPSTRATRGSPALLILTGLGDRT